MSKGISIGQSGVDRDGDLEVSINHGPQGLRRHQDRVFSRPSGRRIESKVKRKQTIHVDKRSELLNRREDMKNKYTQMCKE